MGGTLKEPTAYGIALGDRLRQARESLGLNRRAFAYNLARQSEFKLPANHNRLWAIECGRQWPSPGDLAAYVLLTGCDPAWLLLGDDRAQRPWVAEPGHDPRLQPDIARDAASAGGQARAAQTRLAADERRRVDNERLRRNRAARKERETAPWRPAGFSERPR